MKTVFLLLLVYSFLPCNAKDKEAFYAVSSIPEGLKQDAYAIRYFTTYQQMLLKN